MRPVPGAWKAGLAAAGLCCALALPACAHAPCPAEVSVVGEPRLDPELRRLIAEAPDSAVGVLVLADAPPAAPERQELETAGLRIGSVAGDVVTGSLRACDAIRVAELPFVRYVEAAREIPVPRPPREATPRPN